MASTSSETPSSPGWKFDVFLSFRGEDTRHGFTDNLYEAFISKGIEAFRDNEKLQLGQEIASELIQAIENSQYAIVVFSEKYADSRWCLDELVEIVECKKNKGLKEVVPVFYHVDPSDVRKQTGPFEKDFDEHQRNDRIDREKIQKWKDAMREVGHLKGEHILPHQTYEAKSIQDIVEVIFNKLHDTFLELTKGLIGMESRVETLKSYLAIESNDVRMIGIWGTGGMGKTTLAGVVYRMVYNKFDACCFIENIREESKKHGLHKIQQILLRKLLKYRDLEVDNVHDGVLMIKSRLCKRKILLVLDDVTDLKHLENLAGERCWFGSGSRIMITTRDRHLLGLCEEEIYEAEVLNHEEALQLFSLKAFKMDHPTDDYGKLSQAFVDYCKGLPLALEVLGSSLFKKSIEVWESKLGKLNEVGERTIFDVLQISFDGLDQTEKDIFLNIACFFNHNDQNNVKKILDYLGLHAGIGLEDLIDKSLIKLHENQLWMHDLLQEMGRDIVRSVCKYLPEECSRLWSFDDINNVLTENTGTEKIQYIVLEMHEPKNVDWDPEAFSKMRYLKLLKICGVQLMHDLKHLPNSLRILDWKGYPSKSLTSSSRLKSFENLKFMNLSESLKLIEAPDIIEVPNLESLVLKSCINLRRIHPSIGIHKKLTILDLQRCENLTSLPSKFEIERLEELNLNECSKITEIPEFGRNMNSVRIIYLGSTAITTLPTSIEHLTGLVELSVNSCKNLVHLPNTIFNLKLVRKVCLQFCTKLDRLPENLGNAESLEKLDLWETGIREVPSSIGLLKHLHSLTLTECKGLSMPTSPHPIDLLFSSLSLAPAPSLTRLLLSDCNLKAIPNDIGSLVSLEWLVLDGNDFDCLPESIIQLSKLKWMHLNNCTSLRSLPKLPLNVEFVEAEGCISLEMLPDPLKQSDALEPSLYLHNCSKLADNQSCIDRFISGIEKSLKLSPSLPLKFLKKEYEIFFPGSEIPEWFSHQSMGDEVEIKIPSHLCKNVGIAFCFVFCTHEQHDLAPIFSFLLIANGKEICIGYYDTHCCVSSDLLCLVYATPQFFDEEPNKLMWEGDGNGFSQIRIKIEACEFEIKKWGFRMMYKEVKSSRDDYNGAGPSGEGSSKRIKRHTETNGNSDSELSEYKDCDDSDSEESSEYKDCDEEFSDCEESNERNPDG
ncbi:disease resistance protein RUN1-like [Quercus robur]|uniref:disease resistance protein RUN1-like n=1 Tax=Quercus robur TaxID=38942 RepID=UPI002163BAF8|nr:disease resistance protein RUN1-like [Quercus robur]